jgi:hypothetical protein
MTEPASSARARATQSYLDRLGIRPRRPRARPVVEGIEIGEAEMLPPEADLPSAEDLALTQRRPSGVAEGPNLAGERIGTELSGEIPREWLLASGGETREQMIARTDRAADRARRQREQEAAYERNRDAAYDRSLLDGLQADNRVNAVGEGVIQGLTLGFGDEIGAAGRVLTGAADDYESERDRLRGNLELAQREAPTAYGVAEFAGSMVPAMAVPGAAPGASLTRRVLTSTLTGAGFGGASGVGHSNADTWQEVAREGGRDALIGGALGGGVELGMEGGRRLLHRLGPAPEGMPTPGGDFTPEQWAEARRRMDAGDPSIFDDMTRREGIEEEAAIRRIRSTADDAAMTDVRRAGDHPGAYRELARRLDETGISPRGSVWESRAGDAQTRAARIEDQAGRQIGRVTQQMDDAARSPGVDERLLSNTDDEIEAFTAQGRAERDARRALEEQATAAAPRGRQRQRPVRERPERPVDPGYEPTSADEARAAVIEGTDPALVRYASADDPSRGFYGGTVTVLDDTGRARAVPGGNAVDTLRADADAMRRAATTPEQRAAAERMAELADDLERVAPERYSQAQARLRALDEEAGYGSRYPNAATVTPDRIERARNARQAVRADMDLAVERTLGVDALRDLEAARARFGTARTVADLGDRGTMRAAGNRQITPSETLMGAASMSREGPWYARAWDAAKGVIATRFLRSNEHALGAAWREAQGDALARDIVRRLNATPETAPMARALAEAQRRGPRAFGIALVVLGERSPEVQAVASEVMQAAEEDPTGGIGAPLEDIEIDDPTGGL